MDKQVFYLRTSQIRQNLKAYIDNLPLDQSKPIEIEVSPPKRTLSQNRKMWPLLHDLSTQVVWFGEKYDEDDWKDMITALVAKTKKLEQRTAPGIGGRECQIRIYGVCNGNSETVVLTHYRMAGTCGTGMKPDDAQGAWGCSECHREVDRQTRRIDAREARLAHAEGVMRTQAILRAEGKL